MLKFNGENVISASVRNWLDEEGVKLSQRTRFETESGKIFMFGLSKPTAKQPKRKLWIQSIAPEGSDQENSMVATKDLGADYLQELAALKNYDQATSDAEALYGDTAEAAADQL